MLYISGLGKQGQTEPRIVERDHKRMLEGLITLKSCRVDCSILLYLAAVGTSLLFR